MVQRPSGLARKKGAEIGNMMKHMEYTEIQGRINHKGYETKQPYTTGSSADAKDRRVNYHMDQTRLQEEFRTDLRSYVEGHIGRPLPNTLFDALYDIAWEKGHANGLSQVLEEASGLTDLLKARDDVTRKLLTKLHEATEVVAKAAAEERRVHEDLVAPAHRAWQKAYDDFDAFQWSGGDFPADLRKEAAAKAGPR